jgi:hypothetical protein
MIVRATFCLECPDVQWPGWLVIALRSRLLRPLFSWLPLCGEFALYHVTCLGKFVGRSRLGNSFVMPPSMLVTLADAVNKVRITYERSTTRVLVEKSVHGLWDDVGAKFEYPAADQAP